MRGILSVLLILILIPVLWAQMAAHTVRTFVLDPQATETLLQDSGAYQELEQVVVLQLSAGLSGPGSPIAFSDVEVKSLVSKVLPADQIQALAETAFEGVHSWLLSGDVRPQVVLDLSRVQTALPGAVQAVVEKKVEALPVCTVQQAAQLAQTYKGGMPPCKSPDPAFNRTVVEKAISMSDLERMIPARLDVAAALEAQEPGFWQRYEEPLTRFRMGLSWIPYGWGLVGILLLLLTLLNLHAWHAPFGWLSAPLLIAGGTMLAVTWVGTGMLIPLLTGASVGDGPGGEGLARLAQMAAETLMLSLRNLGMLVALVGLGCLIVSVAGSVLSHRPQEPGEQAAS